VDAFPSRSEGNEAVHGALWRRTVHHLRRDGEGLTFSTAPLEKETEITGLRRSSLRFLLTADADLFAVLRVFDPKEGKSCSRVLLIRKPVGQGWLRASHRKLDPKRSLPYRPFHAHDEKHLEPDEVVELDVGDLAGPASSSGGLRVALTDPRKRLRARRGSSVLSKYEKPMRGCGPFIHDGPTDRPPAIFGGKVTLRLRPGNDQASLAAPVIPRSDRGARRARSPSPPTRFRSTACITSPGRAGARRLFTVTHEFYAGALRFLPPVLVKLDLACLAFNRRWARILAPKQPRSRGGRVSARARGNRGQPQCRALDRRARISASGDHRPQQRRHARSAATSPIIPGRRAGAALGAHGRQNIMERTSKAGLMAQDHVEEFTARAKELVASGRGRELMLMPGCGTRSAPRSYLDRLTETPTASLLHPSEMPDALHSRRPELRENYR